MKWFFKKKRPGIIDMCGLTGFFQPSGFRTIEAEYIVMEMRDQLKHRGPDDAGLWLDGHTGIALGHRRLSILDLSSAGHQPMFSASGRFVLIFNGEIYNHYELRHRLEISGFFNWRGQSDTETILVAIELWGLEATLKACVGMFALALWDREERKLRLARDRMGEKPLYYGWQKGVLLFASELKALRLHPNFEGEINRDALPLYLRHGYIPAPWSIYKGIRKLMPGTWVEFDESKRDEFSELHAYWSLSDVIANGKIAPFVGSDQEAIDELDQNLSLAVAGQRLADVPLGAFLSGGIDSSAVVALMQAQSSRPIKTFTIGFEEAAYNEAKYAKEVANHLGTYHHEMYITSRQAQDMIPKLPLMYDEPFGDSSAIPTHLVSLLAKDYVSVSLSGDGGDELFGGYRRYFKAEALWCGTQNIPSFLKSTIQYMLSTPLPYALDSFANSLKLIIGGTLKKSFTQKASLLADLMECHDHAEFYQRITSHWNPLPIQGQANKLSYGLTTSELEDISESVQFMMALDTVTYLPDDILVKVDRSAMAVSLETRVPLLDHRIVELAWRMPYHLKVRNGQSKWLLRQLLYKYVPKHIVNRPKMGFGVPVDSWIRGPLRDWAEALLEPSRMHAEGFLDEKVITARWREHLYGHHNWRDSLWIILMWQAWLQNEHPIINN